MSLVKPSHRLLVETKTNSDTVSKVGGILSNVNSDDLCPKNNIQFHGRIGEGIE